MERRYGLDCINYLGDCVVARLEAVNEEEARESQLFLRKHTLKELIEQRQTELKEMMASLQQLEKLRAAQGSTE